MAAVQGVFELYRSPAGLMPERALEPAGQNSSVEPSDERLMEGVRAGDEPAFTMLVERYQRRVVAYLLNMLRNREDALDGAQEVFIRLHGRAHLYEPSFPFRCWLYRMATNVAIDAIRRRRRRRWVSLADGVLRRTGTSSRPDRLPELDVADTSGHSHGALGDLLDSERTRLVRAAIATLPEKYRAVLVLRDLQELSYEEVAGVLACQVGTVKSRVNRARSMLRDKLAGYVGADAARVDLDPEDPSTDAGRRSQFPEVDA